jgi:hypothetical protein
LIFCHILKIEPVEMGKPAVLAPYGKMPAADCQIMRAGHMAMPAFRRLDKPPEIIAPDLGKRSGLGHLLNTWDKNPGGAAIFTFNLSLVGHRFDDLVSHLFAVITIGAVPGKDEPVAHERYWER